MPKTPVKVLTSTTQGQQTTGQQLHNHLDIHSSHKEPTSRRKKSFKGEHQERKKKLKFESKQQKRENKEAKNR